MSQRKQGKEGRRRTQDDTSLLPPAFELVNDIYIYISRLYRKTEHLHRIKTFFFAKHILYDWLPRHHTHTSWHTYINTAKRKHMCITHIQA